MVFKCSNTGVNVGLLPKTIVRTLAFEHERNPVISRIILPFTATAIQNINHIFSTPIAPTIGRALARRARYGE
jgi:hypothetical protein